MVQTTTEATGLLAWLASWLEDNRVPNPKAPCLEQCFTIGVAGRVLSCATNGRALLAVSEEGGFPRVEDSLAGHPREKGYLRLLRNFLGDARSVGVHPTDLDAFRTWLGERVEWVDDGSEDPIPPEGWTRAGWIYGAPFNRNLVAGVLMGVEGPVRIGARLREATLPDGSVQPTPELYVLGGRWMALVVGLDPAREAVWGGQDTPRWPVEG